MKLFGQRCNPDGIQLIIIGRQDIRTDFDDDGFRPVHGIKAKLGCVFGHGNGKS